MATARDLNGYYQRLGLTPGASASAVKAAYRTLARELHPDVNHSPGATEKFQRLQEAYAVLSDVGRRAEYDADSAVPADSVPHGGEAEEPIDPVACSRCGGVTARPRVKVFYRVYGWLYGATRTPHQGVYCSACEFKVGVTCSAITMVTGWWSVIGFFWTITALFQNLVGGRFHFQDAQLRAHQAYYFARQGRLSLAAAVARSALSSLDRAASSLARSGRSQAGDALRSALQHLIDSIGEPGRTSRLKPEPDLLNRRFAVQVVMLLVLVVGIASFMVSNIAASRAQEAARLEAVGIAKSQAAAIARNQAAALDALRQPLPSTGILDASGPPLRDVEGRQLPWALSGLFVLGGFAGMHAGRLLARRIAGPRLQKLFAFAMIFVAAFVLAFRLF
jgi:curved DNA-binding protein CbpA